MNRRRLGRNGTVGPAIAMALMLAISGLRPGAVATFAQGPAPAVVGGATAGKEAGPPRSYSAKVIEKGTHRPIAGATVKVRRLRFPDPETGGRRVLRETTHATDAEGVYRFTIPPEQLAEPNFGMIFEVKHFDYPPEMNFYYDFSKALRVEAFGGRASDGFDIELQRGEPVTGVVVTPGGKPAAGVLVHFSSYFAPEAKPGYLVIASIDDARTDDRGFFRFVMTTPGEGELSFYPERYAVSTHRLKGDKRGDLGRFALREGMAIEGRVLDADGTPLPGVVVNAKGFVEPPPGVEKPLLPGEDSLDSLSRSAITDALGQFAMGPLPPGSYRVGPVESDNDPLLGDLFQRLPAPFAVRKVTLKEGNPPGPLEIRAMPSVVVEARIRDSKGRPAIGQTFQLAGQVDAEGKRKPRRGLLQLPTEIPELPSGDDYWHGWSWPDAEGKIVWHAPRGLEGAQIPLMNFLTEERYALRHRIGKDEALRFSGDLTLGSLDHDVKDIEIVRYVSPTVLVKVVDRDGSKPRKVLVTARYPEGQSADPDPSNHGDDPRPDVSFAGQDDGRFRSMRLLPDRKVTIHAKADGYRERSATLELPEGAIKELELVLDKQ